jgi:hypothetical protein
MQALVTPCSFMCRPAINVHYLGADCATTPTDTKGDCADATLICSATSGDVCACATNYEPQGMGLSCGKLCQTQSQKYNCELVQYIYRKLKTKKHTEIDLN